VRRFCARKQRFRGRIRGVWDQNRTHRGSRKFGNSRENRKPLELTKIQRCYSCDASVRHFAPEIGRFAVEIARFWGRNRRSVRLQGEKPRRCKDLHTPHTLAHDATQVTHGGASPASRKFASRAGKIPKIRGGGRKMRKKSSPRGSLPAVLPAPNRPPVVGSLAPSADVVSARSAKGSQGRLGRPWSAELDPFGICPESIPIFKQFPGSGLSPIRRRGVRACVTCAASGLASGLAFVPISWQHVGRQGRHWRRRVRACVPSLHRTLEGQSHGRSPRADGPCAHQPATPGGSGQPDRDRRLARAAHAAPHRPWWSVPRARCARARGAQAAPGRGPRPFRTAAPAANYPPQEPNEPENGWQNKGLTCGRRLI